jgi:methylmalonyl-CoA/ethylmalonyl-CoA epimerase
MIKNIEHIGIAVKNIETANEIYSKLLGVAPYKSEEVESEMVITSFFKTGENKIELLEARSAESAISKFIEKKGEGIHHIAFEVDDIVAEMENLKNLGFTLLSDKPKRGADNKLICFVHPKSANGVLVELCQEIK